MTNDNYNELKDGINVNLTSIASAMAYLHSIEYLTPQEVEEKEMKAKEKDSKGGKKVDPKKKGQEVVVEQEEKVEEEIKVVRSKHFIKLMSDQLESYLEEIISIWYPEEFTKDFRQIRD